MNLIAGPLRQPGTHFQMLVGGVVVDDQVNVQLWRDAVVEAAQKREKLSCARSFRELSCCASPRTERSI